MNSHDLARYSSAVIVRQALAASAQPVFARQQCAPGYAIGFDTNCYGKSGSMSSMFLTQTHAYRNGIVF
jgi:hypothetical protein